jgi:hypothetical protein
MSGIHHLILGTNAASLEAPPSVPITPTPTGKYYTFTASAPFVLNGALPVNASIVVVGGGAPGTGGTGTRVPSSFDPKFQTFTPAQYIRSEGSGGKSGVVNYQPSANLAPGPYSVIVGAATSASGLYYPPGTLLYGAAGSPGNTNTSPGTGGAGSSAPGSGTSGGAGTPTIVGTYGGGGGGGPGGAGGPGGGGPAGIPGVPGTANTGSGGGGGNAPPPPGGTSTGGTGAAGVVVIHGPLAVI